MTHLLLLVGMVWNSTLYFARGGAFDWVWDSKGTRAKTEVSL
jgi:hypothetical protein